jgi:gliding motility-associated-like protein
MTELSDGSIILAGNTNNYATENDDVIITKLTTNGDIIWNKIYKSRFWGNGNGSTDYFYIQQIKSDPVSGEIYFCGPFWTEGKCLVKIDQNSGNIIWGRSYSLSNTLFDTPFGFDIKPDEVVYFGKSSALYHIFRINKLTGDTIQTKFVQSIDTTGIKSELLGNEELMQLNNGNYVIAGDAYDGFSNWNWDGVTPKYQASFLEFDQNLNFVKAFTIRSPVQNNGYNTKITIHPDGSGFFSMLEYFSGYTSNVYYMQFQDRYVLKERRRLYSGEGMPFENNSIKLTDGSDMVIKLLGDSAENKNKIEFLKLHVSDTSSNCLGYDHFQTFIQPLKYSTFSSSGVDSAKINAFQFSSIQQTITSSPLSITKNPACFQVSHCDTLKLIPSTTSLCVNNTLTISTRKNKECGTIVPVTCDTSILQSLRYINDSTVEIKFRSAWSGYIYGTLQGCELIKDSVFVNVLAIPSTLNLGEDKELCQQNTILLNAKSGYVSYLWQDGSTDSTYLVTQPGMYHVTVKDACNNTSKDTINIASAPPVPLSIGPDKTKCNNDTLNISAPPDFLNYTWGPNYNISTTNTQSVIVNPARDTVYYVKAEKTPGCFGFDTIRIKVNTSPPINLGNDVSFCSGDSIVLNAGTGFTNYQWSNGSNMQNITIKAAGSFSVRATTLQGCSSADTLKVMNVFPNPLVKLNKDTGLCIGTAKVLDASNFASYLWNNGSTSQTISINNIGTYAVLVTDNNGCKGRDTARITTLYQPPALFLPQDTAICSYGTLELSSNNNYETYLWNTGSSTKNIIINRNGLYWLQVKDKNSCVGIDTVTVSLKECLQGFFMPNAFTPDGNNLNDDLKPLIFGKIKSYRFTVFNRYGQVVFQSNDRFAGWSGLFNGVEQPPGSYAWLCAYQLENEAPVIKKGTAILIR